MGLTESKERALTMTEDELAYFADVASQYADGRYTSGVKFDRAQPAECHENADLFFEQFPDYEVVRGCFSARSVEHQVSSELLRIL